MVKNTRGDKGKESRRRAYVRALKTIPQLTVNGGRFLRSRKTGLLIAPRGIVTSTLVIVSNDSDLVGVINPHSEFSGALDKAATFYREIRRSDLVTSQFAVNMEDAKGSFFKPLTW